MICQSCRDGGESNAQANRITNVTVRTGLRSYAIMLHGLCRGGTWCDCHHRTGEGLINLQLLRGAT